MIASLVYRDGLAVVNAPFNRLFVDELKAMIPVHAREWKPETKTWLVNQPYDITVANLLRKHYAGAAIEPRPTSEGYEPIWPRSQARTCGCTDDHRALGVCKGALPAVVTAAYRAMSKQLHPDTGGSNDAMLRLNAAYERVMDEVRS